MGPVPDVTSASLDSTLPWLREWSAIANDQNTDFPQILCHSSASCFVLRYTDLSGICERGVAACESWCSVQRAALV